MSDLSGRSLGHYRIVERIGAGGMGEVYRARDERLDRDVAIKVLPEAVASDPERMRRFEREAKALAALNHPNIATLHGLEEDDGQRFLVMELVEGLSLADTIVRGGLGADRAVALALQIAQALEAAHGKGIVHRDLKPANVMVGAEDQVKVLDFGLAKAFDPEISGASSPESLAESPTITEEMTRAGTVLGTAAYMSPEQAVGKAVDKRADIWAFGCVLYEMLSGARTFAGSTSTEILAAIIKDEPDWEALPAATPATVRRLLQRCLAKNPRDRLHDIADARIELEAMARDDELDGAASAPVPGRHWWQTWLPWAVAAIFALFAVAAYLDILSGSNRSSLTKVRVSVQPAAALGPAYDVTHWKFALRTFALSPDGRALAYIAADDSGSRLYLRQLDEDEASAIEGTEGALSPFFSPDGQWIGFWAEGKLKKVRPRGGPPIAICESPEPDGVSWGPGNDIFFGDLLEPIRRVPALGGMPEEVTSLAEGEVSHLHPRVLGDGEWLLFTVRRAVANVWDQTDLIVQSLKTGERRVIVENGADARVTRSGYLVFVRMGALMAAPFDVDSLELRGTPVVVLPSLRQGVNAGNVYSNTYSGQYDTSASGYLAYVPGGVWPDHRLELAWVDRDGEEEKLALEPGPFHVPRVSPDGSRIALHRFGLDGEDIWIYDIARRTLGRLTFENGGARWPVWSPRGDRIAFARITRDIGELAWISSDGSSNASEQLAATLGSPSSWAPDGSALAYVRAGDIWILPRDGEPRPFIESTFFDGFPVFSRDGRWLAYASDQTGRSEVFVTSFPGPGPRVQISNDGGRAPTWAPNGRELFFRGLTDGSGVSSMWRVDIATDPRLTVGRATELFRGDWSVTGPNRNYDVAADGRRFLMCRSLTESPEPVTHIHLTLNWFEELERLVPTD